MENKEIFSRIDHTLLKATATQGEISRLCEEASSYGMASACLPPAYIARARASFPQLRLCTVVGFPLGYQAAEVKAFETRRAIDDGADEVDAVINLGNVKNVDSAEIMREIGLLRAAAGDRILKIIVETCYLTESEKISLCRAVTLGGADYIKTSTGLGSGGAKLEDIALLRKYIGQSVRIKASGGIRTREAIESFLAAGCERVGTSSAIAAIEGA
jgi:deoxyribose-phosphate aldolase